MTGSLSVRGEVLPVGGITSKIQAAIKAGFKEIIIPRSNLQDIVLLKSELEKIAVIPVSSLSDVVENSFVKSDKRARLLKSLNQILKSLPQNISGNAAKRAVA
jgi:Lon-like ATP-dependent protease